MRSPVEIGLEPKTTSEILNQESDRILLSQSYVPFQSTKSGVKDWVDYIYHVVIKVASDHKSTEAKEVVLSFQTDDMEGLRQTQVRAVK